MNAHELFESIRVLRERPDICVKEFKWGPPSPPSVIAAMHEQHFPADMIDFYKEVNGVDFSWEFKDRPVEPSEFHVPSYDTPADVVWEKGKDYDPSVSEYYVDFGVGDCEFLYVDVIQPEGIAYLVREEDGKESIRFGCAAEEAEGPILCHAFSEYLQMCVRHGFGWYWPVAGGGGADIDEVVLRLQRVPEEIPDKTLPGLRVVISKLQRHGGCGRGTVVGPISAEGCEVDGTVCVQLDVGLEIGIDPSEIVILDHDDEYEMLRKSDPDEKIFNDILRRSPPEILHWIAYSALSNASHMFLTCGDDVSIEFDAPRVFGLLCSLSSEESRFRANLMFIRFALESIDLTVSGSSMPWQPHMLMESVAPTSSFSGNDAMDRFLGTLVFLFVRAWEVRGMPDRLFMSDILSPELMEMWGTLQPTLVTASHRPSSRWKDVLNFFNVWRESEFPSKTGKEMMRKYPHFPPYPSNHDV
eukprot:TRINITY_DN3070_c0_g1_i1.p1 TRINITY_DN3070_c0_g1~~TRINITY_DN3070_c0_g1_i1.p1  ORF type:complete len:471 (-),score=122.36 TRINITY_DN3070_c0_g1_i1:66-1478(-)